MGKFSKNKSLIWIIISAFLYLFQHDNTKDFKRAVQVSKPVKYKVYFVDDNMVSNLRKHSLVFIDYKFRKEHVSMVSYLKKNTDLYILYIDSFEKAKFAYVNGMTCFGDFHILGNNCKNQYCPIEVLDFYLKARMFDLCEWFSRPQNDLSLSMACLFLFYHLSTMFIFWGNRKRRWIN